MAEEDVELLLVQTGGTIDKDYPKRVGGYAFEISSPASKRILERVCPAVAYRQVTVCQKDSQDITDSDRERIWQICAESKASKIVVTHGTDTMIETALYIQSRGLPGRHVIITGAHKPETFKDSDADFNLGVAVGAVQMMTSPGMYVAMNGKIYPADDVRREPVSGTFVSLSTLTNEKE